MTTHEVEEMLGISKQTLIYYEKEKLVIPTREKNQYRHYSQQDIDTLKFILLLRSMDISIEQIRQVLGEQKSVREILNEKKVSIQQSFQDLENIEQKINDYVKRRKVKISFDGEIIEEWKGYNTLYFYADHLQYNEVVIPFPQIKKVQLSMYSSAAMGRFGVGSFGGMSKEFQYFVDVDFVTSRDTYSFSILNNSSVLRMFDCFLAKQLIIDDPLKLVTLYHEKQDALALHNYIHHHFKKWAKEYKLDNPRDNFLYDCSFYHQDFSSSKSKQSFFHLLKEKWKELL